MRLAHQYSEGQKKIYETVRLFNCKKMPTNNQVTHFIYIGVNSEQLATYGFQLDLLLPIFFLNKHICQLGFVY